MLVRAEKTKPAVFIALQIVAAIVSILNLIQFWGSNLLSPSRGATDALVLLAAVAILGLTIASAVVINKPRWARWLPVLIAATLIAGFIPRGVDAARRHGAAEAERREGQRIEAQFLQQLDARRKDVAARIADKRPYTPDEALDLLRFVENGDLSYRSLTDYSGETFALLETALTAKILDPNGRVESAPVARLNGQPLFLYFYNSRVKPGITVNALRTSEWKLMQILVRNGADLGLADAAELKQDLLKSPVAGPSEKFMRLR